MERFATGVRFFSQIKIFWSGKGCYGVFRERFGGRADGIMPRLPGVGGRSDAGKGLVTALTATRIRP